MVYGALHLVCALALNLVVSTIAAHRRDESEFTAHFRPRRAQDVAARFVYAAGTALASFRPYGALGLYVLVALAYFVPGFIAEIAERRERAPPPTTTPR